MNRFFLGAVGLTYLWLALWCSLRPEETSRLVGFELQPGSGQSEFLTVYGGLEAGMAVCFLLPLFRPALIPSAILNCLVIHGALVAFRTAGFLLYSDLQPLTWKLAAGEWTICLLALTLWLKQRKTG